MKKFQCSYKKESGRVVSEPHEKIEAASPEEAARIFAERHPSDYPTIWVSWGLAGFLHVDNLSLHKQRIELERLQVMQQLIPLYEHFKTVGGGNLEDLPYGDLVVLIDNLWHFPEIRDELSPEECAIREELYKIAFFDKNLQAGLQTRILNQIASGQPSAGTAGPGGSNLARNAAMVGGLAALHKLNQIEENTGDVSEGLGFGE